MTPRKVFFINSNFSNYKANICTAPNEIIFFFHITSTGNILHK